MGWLSVRRGWRRLGVGAQQLTLQRGAATVVVEAYAPNIVRVTMSLDKARALAAAGYGITARPQSDGWTAESGERGMCCGRRGWW